MSFKSLATCHSSKLILYWFLFVTLWILVLATFNAKFPLDPGDDGYTYLGLAKALYNGEGYVFNYRLHTKFPPGIPYLLKYLSLGEPSEITAFVIQLIFLTASTFLIFNVVRNIYSTTVASWISVLFVTQPLLISNATTGIVSEPAFIATLYASLLLLRLVPIKLIILSIPLVILLPLIRTIGVALPIALIADGSLSIFTSPNNKRRDLAKIFVGLSGIVSTAWWFKWVGEFRTPLWDGDFFDSYMAQMIMRNPHYPDLGKIGVFEFLIRPFDLALTQTANLASLHLRGIWISPLIFSPLIVLTTTLTLIGLYRITLFRDRLIGLFAVIFLGIIVTWPFDIVTWPFDEAGRFLLPIYPILLMALWEGILFLSMTARKYPDHFTRGLGLLSLVMGLIGVIKIGTSTKSVGLQETYGTLSWVVLLVGCIIHSIWPIKLPIPKQIGRRMSIATLFLITLFGLAKITNQQLDRPNDVNKRVGNFLEAAKWIKANTGDSTVIMAEEAGILHFASKRRVIRLPPTGNGSLILDVIRRNNISLLVITPPKEYEYLLPTEEVRPICLTKNVTEAMF